MRIELWVDGSCDNLTGYGGWAFILRALDDDGKLLRERVMSDAATETTNNRMELQAVIEGLGALARPSRVTIFTDSSYIAKAFTEGWLKRWIKNGWALNKSGSKPLPNVDLWTVLKMLADRHVISWELVKGHSGVLFNERADRLALDARQLGEHAFTKAV